VRIIDDDDVGTTAGEPAAKRRDENTAAGGCTEVRYLGMALLDPRGENFLEPSRLQN
jgi:hypothetical protein